MKYYLSIFFLLFIQITFACECVVKPKINLKDWNDSDIVFTATLTRAKETKTETNLTFSISEIFKGEINKKFIHYSIKKDEHHDLFHHIDSMFRGQKWIIFNSALVKKNKLNYEFIEPEDSSYCMLSKPITNNDSYLTFIHSITQNPNSKNKTYYKDKVAFAKGSLKNKIAIGSWKYYTRNDLDHYWEGIYVNGKKDGKWVEKAINFKKEKVIISEKIYENGFLKELIKYNYIREKKEHNFYGENNIKKILYNVKSNRYVWHYDKILNTTTIECFKNNQLIKKETKDGKLF